MADVGQEVRPGGEDSAEDWRGEQEAAVRDRLHKRLQERSGVFLLLVQRQRQSTILIYFLCPHPPILKEVYYI